MHCEHSTRIIKQLNIKKNKNKLQTIHYTRNKLQQQMSQTEMPQCIKLNSLYYSYTKWKESAEIN